MKGNTKITIQDLIDFSVIYYNSHWPVVKFIDMIAVSDFDFITSLLHNHH
jgi:hypothetical protein